jgi:hypothetical protein
MAIRYTSDTVPFSHEETVGDIRDELDEFQPRTPREQRLLAIAQRFSELLHQRVDSHDGLLQLLPGESGLRQRASEEFLKMPPVAFPDDDGRLLEES